MLGKTDVKVSRPRDGRHCDLCGCSFPAVRCDKCGSQIFCLSCDDMYHRHPKRRFHLRKAVDPTPTPQARPVLPMKVSQLAASPGDPSKMPLPPPRKKKPGKSFFDSFRRGSPSSDNSPPLPKKEYSWSDRLGSIKKFMSNRPLPPLPKDEDIEEPKNSPPVPRKNDLSFIHKRVDEKPPQLPHRTQAKSPPSRKHSEGDVLSRTQESHLPDKQAEWASGFGAPTNNFQQAPVVPPTQHLNGQANRDSSEREISAGRFRSKSLQNDMSPTGLSPNFQELPNLSPTMPPDVRGYSTLKRPPPQGQDLHNQSFMSMPGDHFPGMHTSSSVTDLHTLDSPSPRGPQQFPNFPMPPHYPHPYPMYPHYPNYPQYFGTSFANLSTVLPNADGDFSDHSDASSFTSKKPKHSSSFGLKAKRSQSVMYDRMAYPPQYYPFGGFPPHPPLPGYGAAHWGQSDHQTEEPASPATSVRSFGRSHRSRHRKKKMVASDNDDEDDERLSVRSSPRSRTTSSSDRLRRRKTPKKIERSASPSSLTSSEEEEEEENQAKEDRLSPEAHTELSQGDGYQTKQDKKKASKQAKDAGKSEHKTKQHGSKIRATSYQKLKTDDKNFSPKVKKKEKEPLSSSESMDVNEEHIVEAPDKAADNVQVQEDAEMQGESDYHSEEDDRKETVVEEPRIESTLSESQWQCEHCTFINDSEHRICQVCFKTKPGSIPQSDAASLMVPEMQTSSSAAASPILNTTSESLTSDTAKEYLTPPVPAEDDSHSGHSENEGQNFAKLNSDLEQAEKELSRGLMELMKLKEESEIANNAQAANRRSPEDIPAIDNQVLTSQDTQIESKPTVPQTENAFPQVNDKIQASNEQLNQQLNIPKIEHVVSKSIGTDAMDFDLSKHQTHESENIVVPTQKPLNFGLFTQDQISPANSFSEITASSPNQKDITGKPTLRRDSSCQTYQDESSAQIESDIPNLHHGDNLEFQHPYHRADSMRSPQLPPIGPSGYRGYAGRGQGLMHRSHSRSSLFGDRYGDARNVPPEFDNLGFGFGPSPMYRSLSRSSLTGDYSDPWMSEVRPLRRPDFYLSMEELVERRRLETKRAQGLELVRMIREAEQQGFTADDIHVALNNCGKQNPVDWLQTNWKGMVDTVVTLATNYGKDKHENDIGVLSDNEARDALRMHKGNIWAAVTECVEGRQRKFLELRARGNFSTKEIVDALTQSEGNVELAYTRLSATTLKPFLMRIWGTGEGVENQDGAVPTEFLDPESSGWPKNSILRAGNVPYRDTERCSDQEDWDDDDDVEEEVSWNEDEEEEMENPENFDIEPQIMRREKHGFAANNIATPESDSEYCDAFDPVGDARSATSSSPVDEIFFVSPDTDMELPKDKKKGTSFLNRLAALRKNKKPQVHDATGKDANYREHKLEADSGDSWDASDKNDGSEVKIRANDSTSSSSETNKIYSPLNILKQTFSAIKDSVIGSSNKNEAKHPRSITEARTIIVHDKSAAQETIPSEETPQKSNNPDISSESPHRVENKNESVPKISQKSNSEENNIVDEHNKTLKSNLESKDLLAISKTPDNQILSVSNSSEKRPIAKQQSFKNSKLNAATSANAVGLLGNTQNNVELISLENKVEDESLTVLTQPLPPKRVEEENTKEEKTSTLDISEQFQNTNDTLLILKDGIKSSKSIAKEPVSTKSEDKFPTQEKPPIVLQKTVDSSKNKAESHPQGLSHELAVKSASSELSLKKEARNDIEMDTSLQRDVISNVPVTNDVIEITAKPPELTVAKSSDEKPKTKKARESLRLKLPDHGKTANSEIQKDQAQPDKQKDEPVIKTRATPKGDTYLEEKQNTIKEESANIASSTVKSRPVLAEQDNGARSDLFQGEPGDGNNFSTAVVSKEQDNGARSVLFQGEPGDGNNFSTAVVSKEGEEKSVVGEKPTNNISENEFHDMASKITEKLENCLEVIKASETAFIESKETSPPRSEKKEEVSTSGKAVQNEIDSSQSNSETLKLKVESTATDASKISTDREEKNNDVGSAKIPSPTIDRNEIVHADDVKPTNKEIPDVIASPDKSVSPDAVEQHGVQDSKTSDQSSTNNTVSNNKFVTHSTPPESSQAAASATNVESPTPQIASSAPPAMKSNKLDEAPVEFAGVKAKTFTGLNKKAKNQLYGSDKKQKDNSARSPTPKATPDAIGSGKVSADEKDFSDIKKKPKNKTNIQETEYITQPCQSETEKSVNSISTKEETVSSSNEHQPQTTPDEQKNEPGFPGQAELKDTSNELVATDTKILNQAEQNTQESPQTANAAEEQTEVKSELANSESQRKTKEKKNGWAATKSDSSVFSSSKFAAKKFKDQDMKSTMSATNKESSVSTSSKITGFKTKDNDVKYASTIIAANSSASVSSSAKDSEFKSKEQEVESVKDAVNTETSVDAANKGSDIKVNEPDVKEHIATTSTEASVSTLDKVSNIKTKEQGVKNETAAANTGASVSDIKVKEQDNKIATTTDKTETAVSIPSESSDTKAKEQETEADTAEEFDSKMDAVKTEELDSKKDRVKTEELDSRMDTATVEAEATASVMKKDTDIEVKQNDTENVTTAANEASASSRTRSRLKVETQGATEDSNVNEGSVPSSPVVFGDKRPTSRLEALKNSFNDEREGSQGRSQSPIRPQSPFGRMTSLNARKEAIANERNRDVRKTPTIEKKPWFIEKAQPPKRTFPKRSIKQQLEFERKIRNLVAERKCRTYRKAEIVVQLLELNFAEEEALQAAHECSNLEQAISYLQQECLLCTGMYPVGQIVSMIHCPHKACRECIKAYFTIQIRDRTIMELLCPFCNEPDISDEDVAQDYFNHLDILLKKLVETDIHELFQRKLRDRVLMKDPNFRWCSQCSSGFIAMPNLKRLICPDCNAITCAKCRRPWEREHEGVSCEAFATWKDANDPEAQSAGLAKLLQEDGIDCPNCHFRYTLAKGGCMHFRCMQCQHDFCSGCSRPFKMGQKCGVSEFCGKLGLHAHHPRNCLFYLRDKDPEDLQRLLDLNDIEYDTEPPEGMELKSVCQVMEQKETTDGLVDDICGKEVQEKQAGLCRVHYVEYLGQLVNKQKIDPIQIFCNDDLELVLRRASKRLPAKSYRDSEIVYREKLVQLIQEELPLELTEGS